MYCEQAREKLVEALDGWLSPDEQTALDGHLTACEGCRAEFEDLRAGAGAVRQAVGLLAPRRRYLTAERRERLMAAYADRPKVIRLLTVRRFIGAAAAAAILASTVLLVGDVRQMLTAPPDGPIVAVQTPERPQQGMPVVMASMEREQPMSLIRHVQPDPGSLPPAAAAGRPVTLVVTDTPGLRVPVENAFYDPEESSHWW